MEKKTQQASEVVITPQSRASEIRLRAIFPEYADPDSGERKIRQGKANISNLNQKIAEAVEMHKRASAVEFSAPDLSSASRSDVTPLDESLQSILDRSASVPAADE